MLFPSSFVVLKLRLIELASKNPLHAFVEGQQRKQPVKLFYLRCNSSLLSDRMCINRIDYNWFTHTA
jgi:hypothetical protein